MQYGWTALMCAALKGHLQIAQELLKHGADIDAKAKVMQGDGVGGNEGWVHVWWSGVWIDTRVGCSQF